MNKWISVKDKLPEEGSDVFFLEVIVGEEEYAGFIPQVGYYLEGKFCDWSDQEHEPCQTGTRVTHWLPRPENPSIKEI